MYPWCPLNHRRSHHVVRQAEYYVGIRNDVVIQDDVVRTTRHIEDGYALNRLAMRHADALEVLCMM